MSSTTKESCQVPSKLVIGPHTWTVKFVEPKELNGDLGETDSIALEIKICTGLKKSQLQETLIHEIFHTINMALPEETITFLAPAIYQAFRDNKIL